MTSQSTPIRIPLLKVAGKVGQEPQTKGLPQGLKQISEIKIPFSQTLSGAHYALEVSNIPGELTVTALGIFRPERDVAALNDIYALGIAGQVPCVCKVIKSDAETGASGSSAKSRRKSFMTPTPLHIPESKVSPIPDFTHEMIYLKSLNDKEALKVVPLQDVMWMHPLVSVVENPPEQ
jgi:hypothetical protein